MADISNLCFYYFSVLVVENPQLVIPNAKKRYPSATQSMSQTKKAPSVVHLRTTRNPCQTISPKTKRLLKTMGTLTWNASMPMWTFIMKTTSAVRQITLWWSSKTQTKTTRSPVDTRVDITMANCWRSQSRCRS